MNSEDQLVEFEDAVVPSAEQHEPDIRAVFSDDGRSAAFYDASIDLPERIPADAVPISEEDWTAFLSHTKRWDGSALVDYTPPEPPTIVPDVYDYQFAGQAAEEGIIGDDDALAWVATGKTPDVLIAAVRHAVPDLSRQKRVILFLAGTTLFPRNHELTPLLAASFGKDTPEKVDAFFKAASKR